MIACPVASRLSWRTKYLLVLVLCACVIAWITSLSHGRGRTREQVPTSAEKIEMDMDMERQDEVDEERMPKDLCPETSPLLREFHPKAAFSFFLYFNSRSFQLLYNNSSGALYLKKSVTQ